MRCSSIVESEQPISQGIPVNRIFVVDDDEAVRNSLKTLLEAADYEVEIFDSATAFLASEAQHEHGCVITDVRMPGMSGLELQLELRKCASPLALIVMTGHGDIALAVGTIKAGAADFLEKPFEPSVLLDSVRDALETAGIAHAPSPLAKIALERIARLTDRERQVMELLAAGRPNKIIAYELGISPRTVEIHRSHVMTKMGARSLAELVRFSIAAALEPVA